MPRPDPTPALTLTLALLMAPGLAPADDAYRAEAEKFRRDREAGLRAEDGWLSVAGLYWVRPGEARIGGDPSSDVLLPASAPPRVGVLRLAADGKATFRPEPGVAVLRGGRPFAGGEIRSDADGGQADVLAVGGLRLILIKRGARHAIRLKDNDGAIRRDFAGLRWFPVAEDWRVVARFVPHPIPTPIRFDTIVGEQDVLESPGSVEFERDGRTYRLEAAAEPDGRLWFVFRDATSGRTTAMNARQLTAEAPRDGVVILDFNRAVNLPCAYTPHATCPIAPPGNRLPIAVEAGEKTYEPGPRAPARAD